MLKETGTVIAIDRDGLWVETLKQSTCAKCAAKSGCGQQLMSKLAPSHNMTFIKALYGPSVRDEIWREGDKVVLGVNENALVYAALLAYGLPIGFMLLGAFLGERFSFLQSNDVSSLVGALVGLLCGGIFVKFHSRFARDKSVFQAYVLGRVISVSH